eukprot:360432-Chlamydomonas_euryale.AAC.3
MPCKRSKQVTVCKGTRLWANLRPSAGQCRELDPNHTDGSPAWLQAVAQGSDTLHMVTMVAGQCAWLHTAPSRAHVATMFADQLSAGILTDCPSKAIAECPIQGSRKIARPRQSPDCPSKAAARLPIQGSRWIADPKQPLDCPSKAAARLPIQGSRRIADPRQSLDCPSKAVTGLPIQGSRKLAHLRQTPDCRSKAVAGLPIRGSRKIAHPRQLQDCPSEAVTRRLKRHTALEARSNHLE